MSILSVRQTATLRKPGIAHSRNPGNPGDSRNLEISGDLQNPRVPRDFRNPRPTAHSLDSG
eukprot:961008-Amorphochlora_amoeboformis.AAC.1